MLEKKNTAHKRWRKKKGGRKSRAGGDKVGGKGQEKIKGFSTSFIGAAKSLKNESVRSTKVPER